MDVEREQNVTILHYLENISNIIPMKSVQLFPNGQRITDSGHVEADSIAVFNPKLETRRFVTYIATFTKEPYHFLTFCSNFVTAITF